MHLNIYKHIYALDAILLRICNSRKEVKLYSGNHTEWHFSSLCPHQIYPKYFGEMYKIRSLMLSAYFEAPDRKFTVTHQAFELSFLAKDGQMVSAYLADLSSSFALQRWDLWCWSKLSITSEDGSFQSAILSLILDKVHSRDYLYSVDYLNTGMTTCGNRLGAQTSVTVQVAGSGFGVTLKMFILVVQICPPTQDQNHFRDDDTTHSIGINTQIQDKKNALLATSLQVYWHSKVSQPL